MKEKAKKKFENVFVVAKTKQELKKGDFVYVVNTSNIDLLKKYILFYHNFALNMQKRGIKLKIINDIKSKKFVIKEIGKTNLREYKFIEMGSPTSFFCIWKLYTYKSFQRREKNQLFF